MRQRRDEILAERRLVDTTVWPIEEIKVQIKPFQKDLSSEALGGGQHSESAESTLPIRDENSKEFFDNGGPSL